MTGSPDRAERGPQHDRVTLPVRDRRGLIAAELRNSAGLTIELLENGSVFAIRHGEILVNQVLGSPVEGGIGNVYLRRRRRGGATFAPLVGPAAGGAYRATRDAVRWEGSAEGVDYTCTLRLDSERPTWYWTVGVRNATGRRLTLDAVLAQDLGIAAEAAVRTNELYTSQYIDHTILEDERLGYLVCSRQNQAQGDAVPWVMHGCLDGAVGWLTDGFQLYGLGYKATDVPEALTRSRLPNRNYQYEFALPALQSRPLVLEPGASGEIAFFAAFVPDHPAATGDEDRERARKAEWAFRALRREDGPESAESAESAARARGAEGAGAATSRPPASVFAAPQLFDSRDLLPDELDRFFGPERRQAEERDGDLLSFFHGEGRHVVLRAKEIVQERPTGHLVRSGRELLPSDDALAVTAWMFGVFVSQLAIGNSSFNKLLSVSRNPLNVLKSSGQRVFVRSEHGWKLLALPSAFEMGPTSARWVYCGDRRTLVVELSVSAAAPRCRLDVRVDAGDPVELLVSHAVVVGANEYEDAPRVRIDREAARVELRPGPAELLGERYPEATYTIVAPDPAAVDAVGGDELLYGDGQSRGAPFVVFRTKPVERFSLVLTGSILGAERTEKSADAATGDATAGAAFGRLWSGLGRTMVLGGGAGTAADDIGRLGEVLPWFVHDGLIHCTSPHGLEQYNGAAWGLRDVCQGPIELFMATGNVAPVREILKIVYEHQFRQTADWPQWFMFDRFREVQATDSHGDVIHWPIKALCDYVEATGDVTILDEEVAWTDRETLAVTSETDSIFRHTERQVEAIERDCIPDTALVVFGGGDWEDTLQPADPAMARRLVSAWTVELAYQTLGRYRAVCERAGRAAMAERLAALCERMREDFNRHLLPDGIVAGLAHFGEAGIEYFLHPRDGKTGVSYRLLPMSRGIISGLFSPEQARRHVALIERHLSFPDGVRLMDRPMPYRGGTSRWFRRAETAASFGREIGLQYVHAHIRYVEAMAALGRGETAWRGLMAVCPIRLDLDVPAALPRQANAYFSSSDAAFADRREASRRFGRLRTGEVAVRGGWRVYSSGPGIYLNQLISNVLGLRAYFDDVVFDPVLPATVDGLTFDFEHDGRAVRYHYRVEGEGFGPREVLINGRTFGAERRTDNPYRRGGLLIARDEFGRALDRESNLVEIRT